MDMASARWLFDQGMGDSDIINAQILATTPNHHVNVFDGLKPLDSQVILNQRPSEQAKSLTISSKIISFGNMSLKTEPINEESMGDEMVFSHAPSRIPSRAREHVLAERKRRERLTQRFIALSSLIPGLKKLDKTSVLGDAIKHIKHLQDRKKTLEKEVSKGSTQSVQCIKKSVILGDEERSFQKLPEIEVRVSNTNLLIRIHCERDGGVMAKIISEIEKLSLTMINYVAMPFGNSTLDITILAQMGVEFNLSVKDLVQQLRSAILNIM